MLKEFKEFALKGNVVDLAVAVIIGAALGKIIGSLVDDIIMPVIGAITGGLDFSNHFLGLSKAITSPVYAGSFVTDSVNFLLVAFILFGGHSRIEHAQKVGTARAPASLGSLV